MMHGSEISGRQRIVRVRRQYNQWVANQTLEDYALRFTAKSARKWSNFHVANTALGAISFLACEAIGATITLNYGFGNAVAAVVAVSLLIFATGLPIAYYAVKSGVDIDLLTRGAGFGYIGSTITSLVYASFTFIFFAIEAAIMSMALKLCFDIPLGIAYLACSLVIIPIVTHGIRLISRLQMWTQPLWILLQCLPFVMIALWGGHAVENWTDFRGVAGGAGGTFSLILFGAASSIVLSLIAQIGEQVDFLRFLPEPRPGHKLRWWIALVAAGPGWIGVGALKILAGSFLAVLALRYNLTPQAATEPTELYRVAFRYVTSSPSLSLLLAGLFVTISQIKINVTNSYAGSIAWSNFFSRLTHSHPGRVVWLVFNVVLALMLIELGVFGAIDRILGLYSNFAVAWIGALVADLVINKPLKLSPPYTEFRRAHLYAFNPVGVGAMALSITLSTAALFDVFGDTAQALAPFIGLAVSFAAAPAIALATRGKYYIARPADFDWGGQTEVECCICANKFEPEDMSHCPAYDGPICSLCCTLDARCHDSCKTSDGLFAHAFSRARDCLPKTFVSSFNSRFGLFFGVLLLFMLIVGITLMLIDFQYNSSPDIVRIAVASALTTTFCALLMICGVVAWLFVLTQESRHVAEEESARQTAILIEEIAAHKRTDAKLAKAKEAAEAANLAKSRYVVSISHEIRAPLNSIFGYAQLLERAEAMPAHHANAVRVIRRSAQHLAYLIDGLLDVSKIEAGRLQLYRDEVRLADLLEQIVDMFRLPAKAKSLDLRYNRPDGLPPLVYADQSRLSQILINLLSNAIKFTEQGHVTLRVRCRNHTTIFEVEDSGIGIHQDDLARVFEPFERGRIHLAQSAPGIGLGLTTTKLLTEIMGGEISLTSVPGRGSTFRVKLFLFTPLHSAAPAAPEEAIRGYRGKRIRVLVADDDPAHIGLMHELLAPLGFMVFSARDGASCLEQFERRQPDLVLLDVSMPVLDGWEVARQLHRPAGNSPVIVMISANVSEMAAANKGGMPHDRFLLKPIEIGRLLATIKELLGLEWTYDAPDGGQQLVRADVPIAAQLQFDAEEGIDPDYLTTAERLPERAHLDTLVELGRIGHVDAIEAKLQEIELAGGDCGEFVSRSRALVREFQLTRFVTSLENLRGDA